MLQKEMDVSQKGGLVRASTGWRGPVPPPAARAARRAKAAVELGECEEVEAAVAHGYGARQGLCHGGSLVCSKRISVLEEELAASEARSTRECLRLEDRLSAERSCSKRDALERRRKARSLEWERDTARERLATEELALQAARRQLLRTEAASSRAPCGGATARLLGEELVTAGLAEERRRLEAVAIPGSVAASENCNIGEARVAAGSDELRRQLQGVADETQRVQEAAGEALLGAERRLEEASKSAKQLRAQLFAAEARLAVRDVQLEAAEKARHEWTARENDLGALGCEEGVWSWDPVEKKLDIAEARLATREENLNLLQRRLQDVVRDTGSIQDVAGEALLMANQRLLTVEDASEAMKQLRGQLSAAESRLSSTDAQLEAAERRAKMVEEQHTCAEEHLASKELALRRTRAQLLRVEGRSAAESAETAAWAREREAHMDPPAATDEHQGWRE